MNNTVKPFTENDDRSRVKMPKIRGIFDHAKPRIISSYNSRAEPSPHTLTRASAPPHLAQPACPASPPRLASPARRVCAQPAHFVPRASDPPPQAPRSRNAQRPALRDNRTGLWQEWFSKPQGKESAIRKVEGRGATTCRTPRKAEREGAQRRTAPLTKGRLQDERRHHGDRQSRDQHEQTRARRSPRSALRRTRRPPRTSSAA